VRDEFPVAEGIKRWIKLVMPSSSGIIILLLLTTRSTCLLD
jgi:hypothetical protein